ncbi:tRNA lysidine(34) synthetase TilS [Otariodibacter sp.]|uniref:tRNA lysidine(34) synthetase TilS n=1 Tax=Otariodibacter sp. TaxID=3030919 RepID=UPI002617DA42|nr:tRNA lysidine(34) synthetase TilS [Otariodibacter sp.]
MNKNMQIIFQSQLDHYQANQREFLIGLSGGIDSVALLHLFVQVRKMCNLTLRAIHIHHGLSPNADSWVEFCQNLCQEWNVPLTVCRVKVSGKDGIEAEARKARYQAIQQNILPNEVLATAHHLDDQAETFFLALKRGSGIKGLSGMQAVSSAHGFTLFRPLLACSKAEITQYAMGQNLSWIEDESNTNTEYDRNFLRQEILPLLNQRWQQFNQMVARASQHCAEQQSLIEELLEEELTHRIDMKRQKMSIADFQQFSVQKQQQLLRLWLEKSGIEMPSTAQLSQIIHQLISANHDKNPQVVLGKYILRRYQQAIFITQSLPAIPDFCLSIRPMQKIQLPADLGEVERTESDIFYKIDAESYRFTLPLALHNQSLIITLSAPGKVNVYGKAHREEMKKIWQQYQVPVWLRTRTPLVFFDEQLVFLLT